VSERMRPLGVLLVVRAAVVRLGRLVERVNGRV
jgi:hypothetical protein